ncbi:cell division protein FtsH [Candidatus Roizmanbacteria bacterium RIFCSPLOWO2_02_FULL_38_10]|uniref:ATP-dependent zinc metalloprotease FtsH n=1 Tax=Candidatus Roizmanbacteria bacterium RIFCSPLOWO2_02_FULL_38_10 TaxID=1802074 RepID=A0A1F7JMC5_9BACT|nr:MAG: cell division protein FtsH [Candidatus Roizmanbacteria bacterium RIFCSPLOWO2_02_FULL_38_10]
MASKNNNAEKVAELKFNFNIKTLVVLLFIGFFFLSIYLSFKDVNKVFPEKSISQLISDIKGNRVKKVEVVGDKIIVQYKNDQVASVNKESQSSLIQTLKDSGVDPNKVTITVKDNQGNALVVNFLSNLIPAILMIAFFIFIFRQARGAQDSIFSFGQARTKKYSKEMSRITFANVAGVDEAKKELEEIVDFLKNPKKYSKLGARSPKGVILVGPAGTGKTLLAKAVAGESNVPFFSIAGSEFMEMLVGIGAARVRDLFTVAKKSAPSIIFIDEVDAIGRTRSVSAMPAHDEREQTLNQILVEMDGFAPNDQVIVIAATNRGDLLDPALLRPGRFDRRVMLDYPDLEGRKAILQIHARGKPFTEGVSWEKIAKRTVGFSGADIENMLNEAAISAARSNHKEISNDDLEEAATKVKLGPEKKRLQSDRDKKITAYHEAGHAIVTHFQPNTDPVHRISIVSRGMSLGFTLIPPAADRLHETKTHLIQLITSMMGGRAAEEVVFSEVTTGAANDFDQATRIAKAMVVEYGMSSLGPVNYGPTMDITEWGRAYFEQNTISNEMLAKIDNEVKKIVEQCFTQAKKLISLNREKLNLVAEQLLIKESLDDDEFIKIVGTKKETTLKS